MDELIERISYGALSSFIGAGIAMAILFWTDGSYEYKFFMIFIIPSFILGLVIGKKFYESVWEIFKAIW